MTTTTLPNNMPSRMRQLKRDSVGRPVPWFVPWFDGKPEFRAMTMDKLITAVRDQLCFVCGERLLRVRGSNAPRGTFVAGPMCLVNRTSAEPPNHADCAEWSARACPFMTTPKKVRREGGLPEGHSLEDSAAGIAIARNPGVTALIDCSKWKLWNPGNGVLFQMTKVDYVSWFAEGEQASKEQVLTSIETGLPALIEHCDEPGAKAQLGRQLRDALRWVGSDGRDYPLITEVLAAQ